MHITLQFEVLLKFSHSFKSIQLYLLFYSLIVESWSSTPAPKPPSKPWAILLRNPFFSLRSSLIPTKAEKTSCFQPLVPLPSDSASYPTSTWLFFFGRDPSAGRTTSVICLQVPTHSAVHAVGTSHRPSPHLSRVLLTVSVFSSGINSRKI